MKQNSSNIKKSLIPETVRLGEKQKRIAFVTIFTPALISIGSILALFFLDIITYLDLCLLIIFFVFSSLGVSVGFHRLLTHKGFETTQLVKKILAIAGSMTAQGPVIFWIANHRMHHAYSDTEKDPHSPHQKNQALTAKLKGFWYAHIGWMFRKQTANSIYFAKDILKDEEITKINTQYFFWVFIGVLLPGVIGGVLSQSIQGFLSGSLWGGLVRISLNHQATWSVNSLSHLFGSRPYQCKDLSTNNFFVALIAMGEGWHNNHHAFPRSAAHGFHWWQIDLSYYFILVLKLLGLAWNIYTPSDQQKQNREKIAAVNSAEQF